MNWHNLNWEMYAVVVAGFGLFYGMMRNFKNDILGRFDKIDSRFDRIDRDLKEIRSDITEVKERLAYLEAANIYTMPLDPIIPNPRSQAAKEMWARRRQKKLEKQDGL